MMNADACHEENTSKVGDTEMGETQGANQDVTSSNDVSASILTSRNRIEQYSYLTSGQDDQPVGRTSLSTQVMEYYNRLCDNRAFNSNPSVSSTINLYNCGASSLPSDVNWGIQTKSFHPEDTDFTADNDNYCTESDIHVSVDVERTQQSQNSHKINSEEHCRNVIGQETAYLPHTCKSFALESAPRERKRWVRPPLVGQASTNDNSSMMQDVSLEAMNNMGTEDDLQHSMEDESLQPHYTEKKTDFSVSVNINESGLHKAFGIPSEVKDLKSHSNSQGKGDKAKACRVVKVLSEIREDIECGKVPEKRDNFISSRSSMSGPSPPETQHQIYSSSCQNQDSSTTIIEAMGIGRAPSPGSVSSVTSSRRLEWDSGADVGYQNYHPDVGGSPPSEGLSTIERIALARGCSAALRLEPEGTAGSMQQLNAMQFKPVAKSSKHVFKVPMAVSTPVDFGHTGVSYAIGTDSESEITPIVKSQAERTIFHGGERNRRHSGESKDTYAIQHQDQGVGIENCNILLKKISSSLTDLNECGLQELCKNSLPRSQSYLSLLSQEDYKTKAFSQYPINGSFPLRHQHKRNNGLATCSLSSSSIATIVPKYESPRVLDKLIQTSVYRVPMGHSVGVQVSEIEKDCESPSTASYFPRKCDESVPKHGTCDLAQEVELEGIDSDIIDKTISIVEEESRNTKHIHCSKPSTVAKQSYARISHIQSQNNSCQINHKLQSNKKLPNPSSALCKGAHKRGSNENQWCLSAGESQGSELERLNEMSKEISGQRVGGKLNIESNKASMQTYANQSEEETTGRNSRTLDSITSSAQTTGSWFIVDTLESANGNRNGTGRRGSSGVVGSANSFEYLPGHVYENSSLPANPKLYRNAIIEDSSSETASSHPSASFADSKFKTNNSIWRSSSSSTLAKDLENGVTLLKDLLNSKSYNSDVKKKLVRQVVNRLIETNYAEDNSILESNVPWVPPKSVVNSTGFVSGYVVQENSQEDLSSLHKVRRTMEREDISGESATEQYRGSKQPMNCQLMASRAANQVYFVADKCVGTVLSGTSSLSERIPLSGHRADSRAETTTTTSEGCEGSSSTSTTFFRKGYAWKELTTQSEKEYEERKHKSGQYSDKSVLLNLCETERENQLSWIRTEIHHLNNLKQLLEKQRSLRNSLLDLGTQNRKESQKNRRNPVTSQNNEISTEHESLRSDATYSSSINGKHGRKSRNGPNISPKPDCHNHTGQISELSSFKAQKKLGGTDKFVSEIHPNIKTASCDRRSIFTQYPTSVELCGKDDGYKFDKLQQKEKAIQVPTSSNVSTNGDTYELNGDILSDNTATGRINVYIQTIQGKSVKRKDSPRSEMTDVNKSTREPSKSSDCNETTARHTKTNASTPLCCCECKKLLAKISSEIKPRKQRSTDQKSGEELAKVSGHVGKQKYVSSSRTVQPKNMDDTSARSCTLSSSGTSGDAVDLTNDSDHARTSVATETVGNIGVQTTQSVSSLPLIRPQWFSSIEQKTNKMSSKVEKEMDTSLKECPCCGTIEDQNDTKSESSEIIAGEWKCSRCLKMEQDQKLDRKCQICGVLESQQQISEQVRILDNETAWKCSDCVARELDNVKPAVDKCIHCERQKDYKEEKDKFEDSGVTCKNAATSPVATKSSIGYILTLDTTTDSISSVAEKPRLKLLEEIKVKVPGRKRHSNSVNGKKREKFKSGCTKENQKPVRSSKTKWSPEDELERSKIYRRGPTLQEYLMANRPDFILSAEYRRHCLDELTYLRELRQKSKQRLLALTSHTTPFDADSATSVNTEPLPPPPLAMKRVFSQRTMRAQTERKYHNLPEVLSKKVEKKRKDNYRTNRLMAEIFARKLQKRVLKGDVNLSNSISVISVI